MQTTETDIYRDTRYKEPFLPTKKQKMDHVPQKPITAIHQTHNNQETINITIW